MYVHFSGEKYSIFTCLFHLLRFFFFLPFYSYIFAHRSAAAHEYELSKMHTHTHLIFQECKIQKEECIWWCCIWYFSSFSLYSYPLSKDTNITLTKYSAQHYIFGKFVSSLISSVYKEIIIFPVLLAPFFFFSSVFLCQAERIRKASCIAAV